MSLAQEHGGLQRKSPMFYSVIEKFSVLVSMSIDRTAFEMQPLSVLILG